MCGRLYQIQGFLRDFLNFALEPKHTLHILRTVLFVEYVLVALHMCGLIDHRKHSFLVSPGYVAVIYAGSCYVSECVFCMYCRETIWFVRAP